MAEKSSAAVAFMRADFERAIGGNDPLPPLKGFDFHELMDLEIKPRVPLVGPFLTEGSLGMVHAWRGLGKTWFVLWLALSLATGQPLLGWAVTRPRRVVYLDGEMQGSIMRDRATAICEALKATPERGYMNFLSRDLYNGVFINIAGIDDQLRLDEYIPSDTSLIIVDNISALTNSDRSENEDLHWRDIATWALRHRSAGRAVLFVHHSGKGGRQRGTSKREDLLDFVISLKRPPDYSESEGCRFILEFEKSRNLLGDDVKPLDAALITSELGSLCWASKSAESVNSDRMISLWELGTLNLADIARELDCHKSTVSRHLTQAQAEGKLKRPYPNGKAKP